MFTTPMQLNTYSNANYIKQKQKCALKLIADSPPN